MPLAAALLIPAFALAVLVTTAVQGTSSALLGASAANAAVCTPDARLAPPGPSAGRTAGLSGGQVARAAYAAGWRGPDLVIAVAVAKAESNWAPGARNENTNGSTDLGLFQINTVHAGILAEGDWRDPAANARMAYQVWTDAGERWGPWVTYWRGTYKEHLGAAQAAVEGTADLAAAMTGCTRDVVTGGLSDPGPGGQASDGYTPRAANVRALTRTRWGCKARSAPCVSSIHGYAPRNIAGTGTPSDHASGNAADIMIPQWQSAAGLALGDEIAVFWTTNAAATGIKYVIWNERIWSAERAAEGWRPYRHPCGCGGATLAHKDHVHVSVKH